MGQQNSVWQILVEQDWYELSDRLSGEVYVDPFPLTGN
jgi:hypothetical protein